MKTANPATIALINTGDFFDVDLYTITLFGGGVLRYATAAFDVTDGTNIWSGRTVLIDDQGQGRQAHWKVGLDLDTWTVSIIPRTPDPGGAALDFIGSVPWLEAAMGGLLDNADVEISRAYFATPPAPPIPPRGAPLVGAPLVIFAGVVAETDVTHMAASLTIRDYRYLLSTQMPRHVFQAACRHTLFDGGCSLSAAAFQVAATLGALSTRNVLVPSPAIGNPAGSGTYRLGRVVVTSGDNNTFQRTITDWDGTFLTLVNPLPFEVVVGTTVLLYPGCAKTQSDCALFGNSVNYGGQPTIPVAETAI